MRDTKCGCFRLSIARVACIFSGFAALMLYDMIVMSDVVMMSCVFVFSWCGALSMSSGDVVCWRWLLFVVVFADVCSYVCWILYLGGDFLYYT